MKQLTLLLLLVCSIFAASAQSVEDKIWQRVEALNKAIFETKDSIALKELVSDEVTYGHSSGNLENKQLMVTNAAKSPTTYKNIQFEKGFININKKTAIARHNFRAISVENGKESPLNLGILQVWGKKRGEWVLLARQAVKINPK